MARSNGWPRAAAAVVAAVGGAALLMAFGHFGSLGHYNRGSTERLTLAISVDEVHYTFTGPTSVTFDWHGTARTIRYGRTARYGRIARAHAARPAPISSPGPFWEAVLGRLKRGTTYHYSIGGRRDQTFATAPAGSFRFDVEADVGDSRNASRVLPTQAQIAADRPAFVIVAGDLTYGNEEGQAAVDQHFDDVMAWSQRAAYMPAWGNHDWDQPDDLRNYKGRFAVPHGQASPGAPSIGGEDWGWFDAGAVRFISYPEPYTTATWTDWESKAAPLFAAAQADPRIHFIVTFGHRPAYSTGYHSGESTLAAILNRFGDRYSKYVLNLNGHSHDYERFQPIHHVVHITAAGGGSSLESPWRTRDARTAYRAMHLEHVRVSVTPARLLIQAVCGPSTSADDISCPVGSVIDSDLIPASK
jgi:calcineurin-like phosphoesterase family protein